MKLTLPRVTLYLRVIFVIVLVAGIAKAITFAATTDERKFNEYLAKHDCVLAHDFGKPVVVALLGSDDLKFNPPVKQYYVCKGVFSDSNLTLLGVTR